MRTMSVQQLFCLFLFFLVLNSVVCGFYIKRKMADVKTWVFFLDTKHAKHLMCFVHCDELSTCERDDDDEEYCVIILCVWYDGCNSMMLRRMAAVVIIIVFNNRSARCTAIRPHIFPFFYGERKRNRVCHATSPRRAQSMAPIYVQCRKLLNFRQCAWDLNYWRCYSEAKHRADCQRLTWDRLVTGIDMWLVYDDAYYCYAHIHMWWTASINNHRLSESGKKIGSSTLTAIYVCS